MTTAEPTGAPPDRQPSVAAVLGGALVALFAASATNSIVGIALPTIAGELGGQHQVAWVASAGLLTMTASTPVWGKAADRRGPRPLLLAAIAVFVLASLVAGFAGSMPWLIAGRALQGVGAGGILALTNTLVAVLVPARERGRYTAWFGASFGIASVAGPLLGGLLVDTPGLGWRWCFLGVAPIGLVAALLVRFAPHRRPEAGGLPVDHLGAALLSGAAAGLVLLLSAAGVAWPWVSWPTALAAAALLVLTAAAVVRERRAPDPIVPPRLLRIRTFGLVSLTSFLLGVVMFAGIIYLPQYLQVVRGADATASGLLMLPQVGTMIIATFVVGHLIVRYGRWKIYPIIGCLLLAAGLLLLSRLSTTTPLVAVGTAMALLGVGIGMTQQVLILIAQESAGPGELGVATSTATFVRTLGGAVGVAAFGALISARLHVELRSELTELGLPATDDPSQLLGTPGEIGRLPAELVAAVRESYTSALDVVFLSAIPAAVVALVAVALCREIPLRTHQQALGPAEPPFTYQHPETRTTYSTVRTRC
jgi:EmrB/QacA subfamily drug resistance transporter